MINWVSDKPHYENVPFEIPDSWEWVMVEDIASIIHGRSQSAVINPDGIYPIYGSGGIMGYADDYLCPEHCTIIGRKGTINNPILIETKFWNVDTAFGLHPHEAINYIYFHYFCKSFDFTKLDKSTTLPSLTKTSIEQIHFPLPPLAEQQRIVAEVEKWFALIDELEANKEDLKDYIKQVKSKVLDLAIHGKLVPQAPNDEPAIELLKRINPNFKPCDTSHYENLPHEIPLNWVWVKHNDVISVIGGAQPPKSNFRFIPQEGYIILYQIRDYGKSPIPVYIPIEMAQKTTRQGDILLARYGASLGKVFIAEEGAYNVAMAKAELKCDNIIEKDFLYYYYLSDIYQTKLKSISRTAQAGFNATDLSELYFPIPPLPEQRLITKTIKKIFSTIDSISAEL